MRAAVDEEGRQVATERRRGVVDGKHGERQVSQCKAIGERCRRCRSELTFATMTRNALHRSGAGETRFLTVIH